jgi:hypothetical protein
MEEPFRDTRVEVKNYASFGSKIDIDHQLSLVNRSTFGISATTPNPRSHEQLNT